MSVSECVLYWHLNRQKAAHIAMCIHYVNEVLFFFGTVQVVVLFGGCCINVQFLFKNKLLYINIFHCGVWRSVFTVAMDLTRDVARVFCLVCCKYMRSHPRTED